MRSIDFKYVEKFINSILEMLKNKLDKDTIDTVRHYLDNGEYEMAFEGLFIEIMNLNEIPRIDFLKSQEIGQLLKLDKESVFDFSFWKRFDKWLKDSM